MNSPNNTMHLISYSLWLPLPGGCERSTDTRKRVCTVRRCGISRIPVPLAFAISLMLLAMGCGPVEAANDVTDYVERIGNPLQEKYKIGQEIYARNVWDLQAYDGRLYLGAGNSSNVGPARNAGPVPILSWDPTSKKFTQEFTVDDEQIDLYYVFGEHLYIPGHDPREGWELGNFYCLERGGSWKKHRNIPQGIHTYAMHFASGVLFAGLGVRSGSAIAISRDEGRAWTKMDFTVGRTHAFLEAAGVVYATDIFFGPNIRDELQVQRRNLAPVHEFDGKEGFQERPDLAENTIFPGIKLQGAQTVKVVKPVSWREGSVYIGGYCHNDHQFIPFGVYFAKSLEKANTKVQKLALPGGEKAWDLLVNDNRLFVLLSRRQDNGQLVRVVETRNFKHAREVLRFQSATFARSFEFLDGDLYFGLGCEIEDPRKWHEKELHPLSGDILRVKKLYFQN